MCETLSGFNGSAMQLPFLFETGSVWYSDLKVYLPYLLSLVQLFQGEMGENVS